MRASSSVHRLLLVETAAHCAAAAVKSWVTALDEQPARAAQASRQALGTVKAGLCRGECLTALCLLGRSGPPDSRVSELCQAVLPVQRSKPSCELHHAGTHSLLSCCAARKYSLERKRSCCACWRAGPGADAQCVAARALRGLLVACRVLHHLRVEAGVAGRQQDGRRARAEVAPASAQPRAQAAGGVCHGRASRLPLAGALVCFEACARLFKH